MEYIPMSEELLLRMTDDRQLNSAYTIRRMSLHGLCVPRCNICFHPDAGYSNVMDEFEIDSQMSVLFLGT